MATPGPAAYNSLTASLLTKSRLAPSFAIGNGPKTARDLSTRRIVPGPGAYERPQESKDLGVSFTHSKRLNLQKDENPGPGAYRVPVKFADVPKYLIPNQNESYKFV